MRLNLGVLDVAYSDAHGASGAKTTGEVAEILEAKYHVLEIFFEERRDKIADWLAESIADEISDIVSGARPNRDPFYAAMQNTEAEFRAFLDADEISAIMPITMQITAAQIGVNHRKKAGVNKDNEARPAFVDTGLFQASFRAWVEQSNLTE